MMADNKSVNPWVLGVIGLALGMLFIYGLFPRTVEDISQIIKLTEDVGGLKMLLASAENDLQNTTDELTLLKTENMQMNIDLKEKDKTIETLREVTDKDVSEWMKNLISEGLKEAEDDPEEMCNSTEYDEDEIEIDDWDFDNLRFLNFDGYDEFTLFIDEVQADYDNDKCEQTCDIELEYDSGKWDVKWDC